MITLNQNIKTEQNYDSFVIHIKTEDFYEDIADDVEKWFDTSNYSETDKTTFDRRKQDKNQFFQR